VRSITQECNKSFSLVTCFVKALYNIMLRNGGHEIQETEGEAETEA